MCKDHTASSYISPRLDKILEALRTSDWSRSSFSPGPQNAADNLYAKPIFTISHLSTPVNYHKAQISRKVFQLQMNFLEAQKTFSKIEDFLLLMQANRLQQEFLIVS